MKDQEPRRRSAQEFVDLVPKAVSRAALAVVQAASLARALGSTRAAADRRQGRSLGTYNGTSSQPGTPSKQPKSILQRSASGFPVTSK